MSADPITLEIIQNSLQAAADDMFAAMKKTAMSSIIYEVLDMGTGITDATGRIASSGAGIPAFVGVLDKSVQFVIGKHADVRPGDVFITNDPWHGGVTHLNDLVLVMPVFSAGRLIAWTANIAHNSDVGGMAPGSLSGEATEIFQEGLRLPAVRLIREGALDDAVMEIITANSRMPDFLKGDVWAAIASVRVGARRLEGLAAKYGTDTFVEAMEGFMAFGETAALAELAQLPKGTFTLSEDQDDGRVFNVSVTITDTEFVVDLRDIPTIDTGPRYHRDGTLNLAQMEFNFPDRPEDPAKRTFRPLKALPAEGPPSFTPANPAACFYLRDRGRVYDLSGGLRAPVRALPAGIFNSICGTSFGGSIPTRAAVHDSAAGGRLGRLGVAAYGNPASSRAFERDIQHPAESSGPTGLLCHRMA